MGYRDKKTWPDRGQAGLRRVSISRQDDPVSSGARSMRRISPRAAALSFMEGALDGWPLHQLVTWIDQCLIRPGRLITRYPFPRIILHEPELGMISYGAPRQSEAPSTFLPHEKSTELIRLVRKKVVGVLEGMMPPSRDDRFVQAALYDGRVSRATQRDGRRGWEVVLTEKHALSDQVFALFAADLLERRNDYERNLVICESCGTIDFWPERLSRRGCRDHPEAVVSQQSRRITLGR